MALHLKRELGLFEATMYGVGIIIGAGIYALIGPAAGLTGNALWMAFVIGAAVSIFTGLSYAELSSMFPKEAAEYIYIKKAYRQEYFAFLLGWLIIFTGVVSIATVALGFAGYFNSLFNLGDNWISILVGGALIAILSFVNFSGIKETSNFNIIFTSITILGLLIVIALGVGKFGTVNYFQPSMGYSGIFTAAALIFFAYIGFEDIVNVSEETKKPRKIIPRALLFAVIISTVLYALTSISAVSLASPEALSQSSAPLALAVSNSFLGQNAQLLLDIIALFATAGTVLGILVVTSRMVYGMAEQKSVPKILSRLHKRNQTPHVAILLISIAAISFLFFGSIREVAEITSLGALSTFTAVNLALIWLRFTKPNLKRAFRTPLNIGKYPVIAFLGVFSNLFMIFQFRWPIISTTLIILAIGTAIYILHRKGYIGEAVERTTGINIEQT